MNILCCHFGRFRVLFSAVTSSFVVTQEKLWHIRLVNFHWLCCVSVSIGKWNFHCKLIRVFCFGFFVFSCGEFSSFFFIIIEWINAAKLNWKWFIYGFNIGPYIVLVNVARPSSTWIFSEYNLAKSTNLPFSSWSVYGRTSCGCRESCRNLYFDGFQLRSHQMKGNLIFTFIYSSLIKMVY